MLTATKKAGASEPATGREMRLDNPILIDRTEIREAKRRESERQDGAA